LLFHSTSRKYRTALAGGAATVLATIAIAAPASAAETTPSGYMSVPDGPERSGAVIDPSTLVLPAVQNVVPTDSFHFSRPGG
jgi:hypothetical protein